MTNSNVDENDMKEIDSLINHVEQNSSFRLNNSKNEETLIFTTRGNGDVLTEVNGTEDYHEGLSLINSLKPIFGSSNYEYSIGTVEEWVDIYVKRKNYYKGYEPSPDKVGFILTWIRPSGDSHHFSSDDEFNAHAGIEKHSAWLQKICDRYIVDKTYLEVLHIVDSLPISEPHSHSEKVLIQKAHHSSEDKYDTIPNADFYISRREIY